MSSLHHWLVALGRGLKRNKHKRRIKEEARRERLKLEAYREQMRAEALVEVERLGMMGGRPPEMRLGTYRRHERPKRLEAPDETHHHPIPDEPPFLPILPMSFDPPAAPPDPPSFDPGGPWSTSDSLKPSRAASAASRSRRDVKSREEQLTWAKQRALICVAAGDFACAVAGLRLDLA